MKNLKALFAIIIVSCLFASAANAQAVVDKDELDRFGFPAPSGLVTPYDTHIVYAPDGTINARWNFKLPLTDAWRMQAIAAGEPIEIYGWGVTLEWEYYPIKIVVFPKGKMKISLHYEPAP